MDELDALELESMEEAERQMFEDAKKQRRRRS
jgi:hypothetical protein